MSKFLSSLTLVESNAGGLLLLLQLLYLLLIYSNSEGILEKCNISPQSSLLLTFCLILAHNLEFIVASSNVSVTQPM